MFFSSLLTSNKRIFIGLSHPYALLNIIEKFLTEFQTVFKKKEGVTVFYELRIHYLFVADVMCVHLIIGSIPTFRES